MKRKSLFAVALLLILSTVAFPNERSRFHCQASDSLPCSTTPASPANASEEASGNPGHHMLLHTFIKLLYI